MNNLQVFNFDNKFKVRTVTVTNEPWFVGRDIAEALGYLNTMTALERHVDQEDRNTIAIQDGNKGNPNRTIINESGVYSLIMGSKLESAKRFKRWVTSEVLPSIRKKGSYSLKQEQEYTLPSNYVEALEQLLTTTKEKLALESTLEEAKPKLEYMDKYVQSNNSKAIREAAKILGIKERTFTGFLKSKKIVYVQGGALLPYQQYIDKGYFEVRTGHKYGHCFHQARVTAEGLQWISNIARVE